MPVTGANLASQPTMSRFENRITRGDLYRIAKAFADAFIASYKHPPEAILLDIDDTEDKVYGSQQLSLFNAYFKGYCYQPLHIYRQVDHDGLASKRSCLLKRVIAYLRHASMSRSCAWRFHFSCPEVHTMCDENDVFFILGQSGNAVLLPLAQPLMDQAKALYGPMGENLCACIARGTIRPAAGLPHAASSRHPQGHNIRFVVTNLNGVGKPLRLKFLSHLLPGRPILLSRMVDAPWHIGLRGTTWTNGLIRCKTAS